MAVSSLFTCIYLLCIIFSINCETVTVVTNKGAVTGYKQNGYTTFMGVPYAKVDENNPFGNNLEYPNFQTPFNANDSSIICPQVYFSDNGVIQCLRLNIYVPANTAKLRPILVWFHGGGFTFGSAGEYGGQHLVKEDIIVITANYRLGPYGFMCLDDASVPGNEGLKDQISSLRWIKQNIAAFGGDPSKITIAGESYGGGAVDLHLYSKYETLFQQAIIQSGSVFDEGFYVHPDRNQAIKLANSFGYNVANNKDAIKVLAKEEPVKITTACRNLSLQFGACKEKCYKGVKNFVINDPFSLKNPSRVRNMPVLIGFNSQEMVYEFANKVQEDYDKVGDVFYNELKKNFNFDEDELTKLKVEIRKYYLGNKEIGPESMLELSNFLSDFVVNYAMEKSVHKMMKQGAMVYKYLFSYIGGSPYKNITGTGAMHTEELKYLFEWDSQISGDEQVMIRERIVKLWANFVKFGNPTPKITELLPVSWIPFNSKTKPYMNIDVEMSMKENVFPDRMKYWHDFWCQYENKSVTYDKSKCSDED